MLIESAVTSRFYWLICCKNSLVDNNFDPNYLIAGIPKKLDKSWIISEDEIFVINYFKHTYI